MREDDKEAAKRKVVGDRVETKRARKRGRKSYPPREEDLARP